jgi:hypothetical protein
VQEGVDPSGGQLVEPPVAAARMVDDEAVERAERSARCGDDARGGVGVREVRFEIRRVVVAAPRERVVVR